MAHLHASGIASSLPDSAVEKFRQSLRGALLVPGDAAYGPSYARLAALKQQYDPRNLFRSNQNIQTGPGNDIHQRRS